MNESGCCRQPAWQWLSGKQQEHTAAELLLPPLPPGTHCWEQSSLSCLSVVFKSKKNNNNKTKTVRVVRSCHISIKSMTLFLFPFKWGLAEQLPTLCVLGFMTEKADTDQRRECCNAFTSLCLFCCSVTTEWRAGSALLPPQTCSQTATNGERGGRGQERRQTCATTATWQTEPLSRTLPVGTYLSACQHQHRTLKKRWLDTPCMTANQ